MDKWILVIGTMLIFISVGMVLYQRYKTKRILNNMNTMLDHAISGSFTAQLFDESLLSAVEGRLNRYLTAATLTTNSVTTEREKIKALVADISHQTKTPISNILLYAQLLEEQGLEEESQVCVGALRGQAEKLNFLIAALVKLSRLETGVFALHPVQNELSPMLAESYRQFLPAAENKGVHLKVCETAAQAVFDLKWTTEALCNLLDNAVKYTQAGGFIEVSVKEYELFCRIDVADSGIGLSEEEQAQVFSRFYRSMSVREQSGLGIGLYLTRQILMAQGGYIKVSSKPGGGSVFSMFLPREILQN